MPKVTTATNAKQNPNPGFESAQQQAEAYFLETEFIRFPVW